MLPELFHIGPLPVHSFGLMLAIAFISANTMLTRELKRKWRDADRANVIASGITFIALVAGVIGSKLFHLLENPDLLMERGLREVFSGSGLTFFGGLLLAIAAIFLYLRRKKISFLFVADAASPGLILAYGIGRIGCQLAGDGDYGIPSSLPWAMSYPNGTVPTLSRLNPELSLKWLEMHPGMPLPVDIAVHPTPVYETLACILICIVLYRLQRSTSFETVGKVFSVYLVAAGVERFLVEFIRLNELYGGLSQAQWISLGLIAAGIVLALKLPKKQNARVS